MADIDHFKKVNDAYGHDAGDQVIREIAERIKRPIPDHDMISRIGGEEFFVVLPNVDLEHAEAITERMLEDIEKKPIVLSDKTEIYTTCSFGVYCVRPSSGWDLEHCMKMADQALYASKNAGRNRMTTIQGPE